MNTIEKMARALCPHLHDDEPCTGCSLADSRGPHGGIPGCLHASLAAARVAYLIVLESLREPSEGIRAAMMDGYFSVRTYRGDGIFDADQDVLMFRAAIDFALSEAREE